MLTIAYQEGAVPALAAAAAATAAASPTLAFSSCNRIACSLIFEEAACYINIRSHYIILHYLTLFFHIWNDSMTTLFIDNIAACILRSQQHLTKPMTGKTEYGEYGMGS